LWIRIGFNADQDPDFDLNVDLNPDPGSQTNAGHADPGQTLKSQKVEFLLEKYDKSR
jgi:hypothetical protein